MPPLMKRAMKDILKIGAWAVALGALIVVPVYAQSTGSAAALAQILQPLQAMQPGQSATLLPDGRWLLIGGQDAGGLPTASMFVVDGRNGQRQSLASHLNQARTGHSATLLPDGRILVLGGALTTGAIASAAERFDPATGVFETLPPTSLIPRARHTVTLLADGRLLVAGGVDARNVPLYDAELYNTVSGEVERFNAKLNSERLDDLAALLPASTVLLWGGVDVHGVPLAGAEVYDPAQQRFIAVTAENAAALAGLLESAAAPAVATSEPANGALQIGVEKTISISFSKRLDVASLNAQTVVLLGAEGAIEARVTPAERGVLLFVKPSRDLLPDSPYTLFISGAKDSAGRELPFTALGFRTAALSTTTAETTASASEAKPQAETQASPAKEAQAAATKKPAPKPPAADDDDDEWVPEGLAFRGEWRTNRAKERARLTPPRRHEVLRAIHGLRSGFTPTSLASGTTAVAGQVLRLNGRPLEDATLSIGSRSVRTDSNGEFLLTDVPAGGQTLVIDGRTAGGHQRRYGRYEYRMNVQAGQMNVLPFVIWMTRLDTRNTVKLASPTRGETVITTPRIPGLELRIPRGKVIRDAEGRIATEVSITAIPVDQPPFPLPNVPVPIYFTIQPGGAHLENVGGNAGAGARLIYPNFTSSAPGARMDFYNYDASGKGWYVYGQGSVSKDGKQVIPDPNVAIYEFTGAMVGLPGIAPPPGPPPGNCPPPDAPPPVDPCQEPQQPPECPDFNGQGGDPVDCYTGLFLHKRTDLRINDVVPIEIRRVYRQGDSQTRSFGIGTMLSYDIYLVGDTEPWTYQELILPDGGRVRYTRTSAGTSFNDAIYQHGSTPSVFHGSTMNWNGNGWTLELKNGTSFVFPDGYQQGNFRKAAVIKIADRFGNMVDLTRDGTSGNLTQIISPNGRSISLTYDGSNRITQATDHTGRTVTYAYDGSGRLSSVTDAAGVEQYTYNSNHQMLTVTDKRNNVMVTNVYTNGRVTTQTYADTTTNTFAYTVNGGGQVTQTDITDERGFVRRLAFNANGYPVTVTRALGQTEQQVVQRTVNSTTNLTESKTDALGRVTAYQYDARGNMTQMTLLHGTGNAVAWTYTYHPVFNGRATVTDPLNHTATYQYDSLGNLTSATNALNHTTNLTYTTSGQLASITDPLNHTTSFNYAGGVLSAVVDPLGRTTTFGADALGRTIAVTDPLGNTKRATYDALDRVTARTDARGGQLSFGYDANGNLTSFTDARNNVTAFAYDARNRRTSKTDALTQVETYQYDAAGNRTFVTDRKGQVRGSIYDALGRRTQLGFGAASTSGPIYDSTITYTYDAGNRTTQMADSANGTISRQYDARFDTITQEVTPQGTVDYVYDAAGRRISMTPSAGTQVTYGYDNADRLTNVTQGASVVSMNYDAASRRTTLTLANGVVVTYGHDSADQLTNIEYRDASNTLLGDLTYAYDVAGRRTSMDGSFARTSLPAALGSATYDVNNRLSDWGGAALSYDANGNLLGFQGKSYGWNSRNQLATISGAVTASFAYDALRRREGRIVSGTGREFLHDGLNPIQERSGGAAAAHILTGLGIDEFFKRTEGANAEHYLTDALGSTLRLTDGTAVKLVDYTYEPYGVAGADASSSNAFQYTGRENDGTGLHYYRARYYDPVLKRFISEDPIGLFGGPNFYSYVEGDPVNWVDPLGLIQFKFLNLVSRDYGGPPGTVSLTGTADPLSATIQYTSQPSTPNSQLFPPAPLKCFMNCPKPPPEDWKWPQDGDPSWWKRIPNPLQPPPPPSCRPDPWD
jgi:RHS repeat-associated protein